MQFEFSNLNTQYTAMNADVIASVTKENNNATKSDISSVYDSANLNLDAAVLSISSKGTSKMNAMLSKSIQLRANATDPKLTVSDRREVSDELRKIRREIEEIRSEDKSKKTASVKANTVNKTNAKTAAENTDYENMDTDKMVQESSENILKYANDSIQTQNLNRDHVLQLL